MREMVAGITAIWDAWEHGTDARLRRRLLHPHPHDPGVRPGPEPLTVARRSSPAASGPAMTAVAGEVADGFLVHPVNSRRSLLELTLPALERGAPRAGRAARRPRDRVRDDRRHRPRRGRSSRAAARRSASSSRSTARRPRTRRCSSCTATASSRPSSGASPATTGGTRWPTSSPTSSSRPSQSSASRTRSPRSSRTRLVGISDSVGARQQPGARSRALRRGRRRSPGPTRQATRDLPSSTVR